MYVELTDDFVLVRPYKYGYYEVYSGSIRADKKGLLIPMPDGSRELVPIGEAIGYKVFKYGFPFSYTTSNEQLPMCTPLWQVPIRIGLNIKKFKKFRKFWGQDTQPTNARTAPILRKSGIE